MGIILIAACWYNDAKCFDNVNSSPATVLIDVLASCNNTHGMWKVKELLIMID